MACPRWLRERRARREVLALRARCVGHWAAIGLDRKWTVEVDAFFLEAARRRNGLDPTNPYRATLAADEGDRQ